MPYAVKGETEHGVLTIRTYATRKEAEDHPVKLSLWQRVWVEFCPAVKVAAKVRSLRLPWSIEEGVGSFAILLDADGARIATLLVSRDQRQRVVDILRERGVMS